MDLTQGLADASTEQIARRLVEDLVKQLDQERKAVVGPARTTPARLREDVLATKPLQQLIHDMAGDGEPELEIINARVRAMMTEMEATFDINTVAAMDFGVDQFTQRMYSGIDLDIEGLERLRAASKGTTLILLPSHKSHMDYLILSQAFFRANLPVPLIAAGENLSFFPLGVLFRRSGAFFIRRKFKGDRLYVAVVYAYIRKMIEDGWSIEFFLEGGRSRTGKLLPPKVGLLSMVVDAIAELPDHKVLFCPVSIGYERFVEEKSFVRELSGGEKKKEDAQSLLSSASVMSGRYGRLNVQFGELLSLEQVLRESEGALGAMSASGRGSSPDLTGIRTITSVAELPSLQRRALVNRLAYRVMNEMNRVTAVTGGALVATALLTHDRRGLPHAELLASCDRIARTLRRFGARFTPSVLHPSDPERLRGGAIRDALELFLRAGNLEAHQPGTHGGGKPKNVVFEEAIYVVPPEARLSLDLSKNIVVHFFVARALVATALLAPPGAPAHVMTVRERVHWLSRLFKFEFQFRADKSFDEIFTEVVDAMVADGELERLDHRLAPGGADGRIQLQLYVSVLKNFLEGYRVAARGLTLLLRGPLASKELTKRTLTLGQRLFLAGEVSRREAISRPLLENAYAAFVDQGYLAQADGKLTLPDSYATANTVRTIEARIAALVLSTSRDVVVVP
jgi:glycerol-3-phosphate O-acyltransferase